MNAVTNIVHPTPLTILTPLESCVPRCPLVLDVRLHVLTNLEETLDRRLIQDVNGRPPEEPVSV